VKNEPLVDAAGLVADGAEFDLPSISSGLSTDEERAIADELAAIARIAEAHRKLHHLPSESRVQPEPALSGSKWGHLKLIEVVGRGTYGTVYRAWDSRLDRSVALKLFHGARNPQAVMREGRMLGRIRHENVVTVHGADVHKGIAGIWMEFVHGRRLDHIVEQQGPLSADEAIQVGLVVCRALAAVHAAGLLHCDVKAQNIIREPAGRIVLMDLGAGRVATTDEDAKARMQVAGTPRYMAPELFDHGAALPQTDVYSVGVLLFYLVSGRFPVDGKTLSEIRRAHLEGTRTRLDETRPDLHTGFLREVSRAIDPNPEKRHQTPNELESALLGVVNEQQAARNRTRVRWMAAAAAVLVAASLGIGVWRFGGTPTSPATPATRAVAVLPIQNLTGDPAKAYLADGLTEVLISNLARIRALRVPSFGAVASFRDRHDSSATVAKKLGAEFLLAGSILEVGPRSRITVQLIDPSADTVVWAEELTRDSDSLLEAQAEIARLVAAHLAVRLSPAEQTALTQRAVDPRAQEAYLRGLELAHRALDRQSAQGALKYFADAVRIDPNFALAWADYANFELIDLATSPDRFERAIEVKERAEQAIRLDPTLGAGYVALGTAQFYFDWDFAAAERTFRAGIDRTPSMAVGYQRFSMLLAALDRLPEAIAFCRTSTELEPQVAIHRTSLGILYYYARDYSQAETVMKGALDIQPDFPIAWFGLGRVYSAMGRHAEAIEAIERSLTDRRPASYLVELARAHTAAGHSAEASAIIDELGRLQQKGYTYSLDNHAYIAAAAGRLDEAFQILDQAVQQRLTNVLWLAVDPRVDPLRQDSRFSTLLERIGLRH
jgi:eukaryotic-like serine/threonine-protein kinase